MHANTMTPKRGWGLGYTDCFLYTCILKLASKFIFSIFLGFLDTWFIYGQGWAGMMAIFVDIFFEVWVVFPTKLNYFGGL